MKGTEETAQAPRPPREDERRKTKKIVCRAGQPVQPSARHTTKDERRGRGRKLFASQTSPPGKPGPLDPAQYKRGKNIYKKSIPTKNTKTTKSLVVVLRFCSKLGNRGKQDIMRRSPRPLCTLLAGVAMHTGRDRSCMGRGTRVQRKKKQKRPRKQSAREKPLPPLLAQIGGQRAI